MSDEFDFHDGDEPLQMYLWRMPAEYRMVVGNGELADIIATPNMIDGQMIVIDEGDNRLKYIYLQPYDTYSHMGATE